MDVSATFAFNISFLSGEIDNSGISISTSRLSLAAFVVK